MKDCIFCKIINKDIPATILYEDDKTFVFLDIAPATQKGGHTLVMPKNHYELVSEMSDDDSKAVMLTIKKLALALSKAALLSIPPTRPTLWVATRPTRRQ